MKNLKLIFLFACLLNYHSSFAQYVIRIAGNDSEGYAGDGGPALNSYMYWPYGVCRDAIGNLYFADDLWGTDCCGFGRVRKINAETGIISTIAGGSSANGTGNNIPATSALMFPFGLRIDSADNIYMAEGGSVVRVISQVTGLISVVAGVSDTGYSGDGGPATLAKMSGVQDIALDDAHNLYIVDYIHNVVRKVYAATGIISTFAGNGTAGFNGDGGPATAASFNSPNGIYIDKDNNTYIADYYNYRIRMITPTGIISTIAGNGSSTYSGDGGLATAAGLAGPSQVILDSKGNLYFTDNERIRKVDAVTQIITTYAGNGNQPYTRDSLGDGGPATSAIISPYGMCFDTCGDLYFSDYIGAIRAVVPELPTNGTLCNYYITNSVEQVALVNAEIQIYPNPTQTRFTINISSTITEPAQITITNLLGQTIKELTTNTNTPIDVQINEPPGLYIVEAVTAAGKWQEKILISN